MDGKGLRSGVMVVAAVTGMLLSTVVRAQQPGEAVSTATASVASAAVVQGGTIKGTIMAGTAGKLGIPLPGVAVTATNTLTGKKFSTATGIDGVYAMTIPKNGRYVVKAEMAGFATVTQEVVLTGVEAQAAAQSITIVPKATDFGMELASRVAADEVKQAAATSAATTALSRGLQGLSLSGGGLDGSNASVGGAANAGAALPTLGGVEGSTDAVAVSGQTGTTNGLANFSEDEIRSRIEDAVAQGRASGMIPQGGDPTGAIVGMLGGMMGGRGPGGPGGGGGRGGRGGGGGGFGGGAFRNFNPAQPHGSVFYQGSNSALNSAQWQPSLIAQVNPAAYTNRYGLTFASSPYIPGLTKPSTKQFLFLNLTGQRNLNAFAPSPVRVPTEAERMGDFSASTQVVNGKTQAVELYDPATGLAIPGNRLGQTPGTRISSQAQALLNYYPAPNIPLNVQGYNYQTVSNGGSNNVAINSRYTRTLGQATTTPFGNFGGGGGGGGGRRSGGGANGKSNAPPTLKQNINVSFNYNHAANDSRNIFLALGGANVNDGESVNAGYTVSYGRLSNNASVTWNRNKYESRNYFTDTSVDPTTEAGIAVPNDSGGFADPHFYNGLPSLGISNFAGLYNTTPSQTLNQTISLSDFVSYRHKKHNMRFGFDLRRVHADSIGGNNPLGSFTFTGYATECKDTATATCPVDTTTGLADTTGSGFADFLLGLPQSTSLQAGLSKIYLRENVADGYVTDDYRVTSSVTLNYGLRYEYFGPYSEKNGRLVNLTGINLNDTTSVQCVTPHGLTFQTAAGVQTCAAGSNAALVNPDNTMYSPRLGLAWKLPGKSKLTKDTVVRAGYGINFNTGQFAKFAKSLSFQPPFAATQTNAVTISQDVAPTGCMTTTPTTTANLTLAKGFGCSTANAIQNNFAVDPNYRLGMVRTYNVNIQRTLPLQIVLNVGYTGARGSDLDVVGSPNSTPLGVSTPGVSPFNYETSVASSRSNQLVVSAQKRQQKGISLGVTYTYGHAIDDASSVGGSAGAGLQNFRQLEFEEANSAFDVRHTATGNWLLELPFGPNRAYFNKGGWASHALDGFDLSGNFTFSSGSYFTPFYSGNTEEAASGGLFTLRPDRVAGQSTKGPGRVGEFFNKAAFAVPVGEYGTASRNSIEGPGTVNVSASLSRTVSLGETRSFEARVTASNVFNTVQYSSINTTLNSQNYGEVTSAAQMRAVQFQGRYRF